MSFADPQSQEVSSGGSNIAENVSSPSDQPQRCFHNLDGQSLSLGCEMRGRVVGKNLPISTEKQTILSQQNQSIYKVQTDHGFSPREAASYKFWLIPPQKE